MIRDGGTFLEQEHTVRYLRGGEVFMPKLGFDHSWSEWEATGKEDIRSKAKEAVKEILSKDHFEPLPAETEKEINVIIEKAYQELVVR